MLYLKSCPKCRGDMYLDSDAYGSYRQCLQCGLIKDLVARSAVLPQAPKVKAERAREAARRVAKRAIA